jgi:3-isopropylmalate/(R)-2-methylmalate dehydratase small subunit
VILGQEEVDRLFAYVEGSAGATLAVDLGTQEVRANDGSVVPFSEVDPFRKECLMNGWDDIELSLRQEDKIRAFEKKHESAHPFYLLTGSPPKDA